MRAGYALGVLLVYLGALPGTGGIQCSLCKGVGHERAMCPELRTNSDPPTMVGRGGSGDVRVADNRVPSRFHGKTIEMYFIVTLSTLFPSASFIASAGF